MTGLLPSVKQKGTPRQQEMVYTHESWRWGPVEMEAYWIASNNSKAAVSQNIWPLGVIMVF